MPFAAFLDNSRLILLGELSDGVVEPWREAVEGEGRQGDKVREDEAITLHDLAPPYRDRLREIGAS